MLNTLISVLSISLKPFFCPIQRLPPFWGGQKSQNSIIIFNHFPPALEEGTTITFILPENNSTKTFSSSFCLGGAIQLCTDFNPLLYFGRAHSDPHTWISMHSEHLLFVCFGARLKFGSTLICFYLLSGIQFLYQKLFCILQVSE